MNEKGVRELTDMCNEMKSEVNQHSAKLIRHLKQRDKLTSKLNRNCDILTALLQARSLKRSKLHLFVIRQNSN